MLVWAEEDRIDYFLPDKGYGGSAIVTFTLVEEANGSVLAPTEGPRVPLEPGQPNGPGCPPVCFIGRMTV